MNFQKPNQHRVLDPLSGIPLFHQVCVILKDQIISGALQSGARLPSEAEICETFGISRITAKRAMDELAKEGLVMRARGRGTIVASRAEAVPFVSTVEGWLENISRMADTTDVQLLEFDYRPAPEHVAARFDIEPDTEVQHSIRVRSHKGIPISYLETWVPGDIGRKYSAEDLGNTPLLRLLERNGLEVASSQQRISATIAPPNIANILGIQAGAALLDVRRVVRSRDGRAVEYICILYRPDLYQFSMDLTRVDGEDGARWRAESHDSAPAGRPAPVPGRN
ncbi:MAG: GntR family transcriptional regulator [Halocynthiibacter sp.]